MLHLDIKAMNNTHSSMPKYIYIQQYLRNELHDISGGSLAVIT